MPQPEKSRPGTSRRLEDLEHSRMAVVNSLGARTVRNRRGRIDQSVRDTPDISY
jgi:hypothetical protein